MRNTILRFSVKAYHPETRNERGATATEYGLLVAFIAFLIIVGVTLFGNELNTFFGKLDAEVATWNP